MCFFPQTVFSFPKYLEKEGERVREKERKSETGTWLGIARQKSKPYLSNDKRFGNFPKTAQAASHSSTALKGYSTIVKHPYATSARCQDYGRFGSTQESMSGRNDVNDAITQNARPDTHCGLFVHMKSVLRPPQPRISSSDNCKNCDIVKNYEARS